MIEVGSLASADASGTEVDDEAIPETNSEAPPSVGSSITRRTAALDFDRTVPVSCVVNSYNHYRAVLL